MAEINIDKMAQNVAEKALDEFLYQGKSIREWMQIIVSEDCISRQVVLAILKDKWNIFSDANDAIQESIDTIEALRPVTAKTCDDAVSRQIISDYVQSHIQEINTGYGDLNKHTNEILRMIVDYIESMPPVNPQEPKTGHWIADVFVDKCSVCGEQTLFFEDQQKNYCPNCGARMVEPQESEDAE